MKKVHYSWVICFTGLWMFICNMGLCSNALTIYLPFIEAGGISHSAGSTILSVRCMSSFLTTFAVGLYYKRFSLRVGITLATLTSAVAPLIFIQGGSNPYIYYLGAAVAGIGYSFGCVIPASLLLSNWFDARRGFAMGVSSSGSGVASMLFAPLLSGIVLRYSLKTAFLVQSGFLVVSAALMFLLVRDLPSDIGLTPYGAGSGGSARKAAEGPSEPLSPLLLTDLAVMMLLFGGSGLAFSGHLSVLARTCGYSAEVAAGMTSAFGMTLIVSKMSTGVIADRIGSKRCSIMLMLIFIAGCFLVLPMNGRDVIWCYALVLMLGLGSAFYNVGPALWAGDLSSRALYAGTLKWLQIFYNLGGIIFTVIPGHIAERTGEYKSSFFLFAGMVFFGMLLLLWAYRTRLKQAART